MRNHEHSRCFLLIELQIAVQLLDEQRDSASGRQVACKSNACQMRAGDRDLVITSTTQMLPTHHASQLALV